MKNTHRIVPIAIGAATGLALHLAMSALEAPAPMPPLSCSCGCVKRRSNACMLTTKHAQPPRIPRNSLSEVARK